MRQTREETSCALTSDLPLHTHCSSLGVRMLLAVMTESASNNTLARLSSSSSSSSSSSHCRGSRQSPVYTGNVCRYTDVKMKKSVLLFVLFSRQYGPVKARY